MPGSRRGLQNQCAAGHDGGPSASPLRRCGPHAVVGYGGRPAAHGRVRVRPGLREPGVVPLSARICTLHSAYSYSAYEVTMSLARIPYATDAFGNMAENGQNRGRNRSSKTFHCGRPGLLASRSSSVVGNGNRAARISDCCRRCVHNCTGTRFACKHNVDVYCAWLQA